MLKILLISAETNLKPRNIMSTVDFARHKTSYRNLKAFLKAEAIYDLTYFFLQRHIKNSYRTYDQMLQAARSGKQNIVEGRSDAAASAEMEIKLYGVAVGSLHELLNDYQDFMRTRSVEIWGARHPRYQRLRGVCAKNNDTAYYMALAPRLNDVEFCNLMLTLINQTIVMLKLLIEKVKKSFSAKGRHQRADASGAPSGAQKPTLKHLPSFPTVATIAKISTRLLTLTYLASKAEMSSKSN